jgi:uncharacterized PurR-regulated membrane protein YhhQ (DUF165 family)
MINKNEGYEFFKKVKSASKKTTKIVANTASNIVGSTRDTVLFATEKVSDEIEEKKAAAEKARQEQIEVGITSYQGYRSRVVCFSSW